MRKSHTCAMAAALLLSLSALPARADRNPRPATPADAATADTPVALIDAQSFEAPLVSEIGAGEIADAGREMASAVSAGKFLDGGAAVAILLAIWGIV